MSARCSTYKIVVAVPTKKRLAFSPPALEGWTFVSFAPGSDGGADMCVGMSRVGGAPLDGSTMIL